MAEYEMDNVYGFTEPDLENKIIVFLKKLVSGNLPSASYNPATLNKYDAENTTRLQCALFEQVLNGTN